MHYLIPIEFIFTIHLKFALGPGQEMESDCVCVYVGHHQNVYALLCVHIVTVRACVTTVSMRVLLTDSVIIHFITGYYGRRTHYYCYYYHHGMGQCFSGDHIE